MASRGRGWRGAVALLLLILGGTACGGAEQEAPAYAARGQVVRVESAGQQVVLDHEAIPELMGAMRMSLAVAEPAEARALAPGDKIAFELVDAPRGAYVRGIEKLPPETVLELAGGPTDP